MTRIDKLTPEQLALLPQQRATTDPMTLTWTVDMTTVIGTRWEWDQDGETRHEVKETLGDRVAELLADRIYQTEAEAASCRIDLRSAP